MLRLKFRPSDLIIISLLLLASIARVSAFETDMELGEVRKKVGILIVRDLVVGANAYVNMNSFCWDNKKLHLSTDGAVTSEREGWHPVLITIQPNRKARIKISEDDLPERLVALSGRVPCEVWKNNSQISREFIEITTINGASKISELIN